VKPDPPPPEEFALHAWVDESMRAARDGNDGLYLLAAVVADPGVCDAVRDSLRSLVWKAAGRLNWRDETPSRRRKIAELIGGQDLAHVVVVGAPIDHRRQERARAQCLERLLYELEQLGVSQVWLETRHFALNERDLKLVEALRGKRSVSSEIRVEFARPKDEPMLWVPDAVAGAVNAALSEEPDALDGFGEIDVISVNLS
jgi:hypothetical protein